MRSSFHLTAKLGLPLPMAIAVGALAGAAIGVLVGLPALRVRGHYLAIITLAVGELLRWCYTHLETITYGPGGFTLPQIAVFSAPLGERAKYFVFLACATLGIGMTSMLLRSRFGRAFAAVRNNEQAAASLGIAVGRLKVLAFALSGDSSTCTLYSYSLSVSPSITALSATPSTSPAE